MGSSGKRQFREYRRLTREIERLLNEGRLSEARELNERARALYRTLHRTGGGAHPSGTASNGTRAGNGTSGEYE